jgi:hypothetical protein
MPRTDMYTADCRKRERNKNGYSLLGSGRAGVDRFSSERLFI